MWRNIIFFNEVIINISFSYMAFLIYKRKFLALSQTISTFARRNQVSSFITVGINNTLYDYYFSKEE